MGKCAKEKALTKRRSVRVTRASLRRKEYYNTVKEFSKDPSDYTTARTGTHNVL